MFSYIQAHLLWLLVTLNFLMVVLTMVSLERCVGKTLDREKSSGSGPEDISLLCVVVDTLTRGNLCIGMQNKVICVVHAP